SASFRCVSFGGGRGPQLGQTAWGLAGGWGLQQIQTLGARPSGVDFKGSPGFRDELRSYENLLSHAPETTLSRAVALNGKAWALATHGIGLADAERLSQEALMIVRGLAAKPDELSAVVREEANDMDTLAYIQMQAGKMSEALENLKTA